MSDQRPDDEMPIWIKALIGVSVVALVLLLVWAGSGNVEMP